MFCFLEGEKKTRKGQFVLTQNCIAWKDVIEINQYPFSEKRPFSQKPPHFFQSYVSLFRETSRKPLVSFIKLFLVIVRINCEFSNLATLSPEEKIQMKMPRKTQANKNPHCSLQSESWIQPAKPMSTDLDDDSKMITARSLLYNVDIHPMAVLHMPILTTHKGRTSIDLLSDTDPWSNLKVCHISIPKCISAIIWVIYHLAVAVKVTS